LQTIHLKNSQASKPPKAAQFLTVLLCKILFISVFLKKTDKTPHNQSLPHPRQQGEKKPKAFWEAPLLKIKDITKIPPALCCTANMQGAGRCAISVL